MPRLLCIIPYYNFHNSQILTKNHRKCTRLLREQGCDILTIEALNHEQHKSSLLTTIFDLNTSFIDIRDTTWHNTKSLMDVIQHTNIVTRLVINQPLWYKENLINYAILHYGQLYDYIAWIDSGLLLNDGWVENTINALQKHDMVQCFDNGIWLAQDGSVEKTCKGYVYAQHLNIMRKCVEWPSPGGAWAIRRDKYTDGLLYQYAIVGGGDSLFVNAIFHNGKTTHATSLAYKQHFQSWYDNVFLPAKLNISYLNGEYIHLWHAARQSRMYHKRHDILAKNGYNPDKHLHIVNGILQFTDEAPLNMISGIKQYIYQRAE